MKDYKLSDIKKICEEHTQCWGCQICSSVGDCVFADGIAPCNWEIDEKDVKRRMKYEMLMKDTAKETCGLINCPSGSENCRNCTGVYCEEVIKALQRLAELEDKIEDGRLVELPCKVGDRIYCVYSPFGDIDEWEITEIDIRESDVLFRLGHKGTDDYAAIWHREIGENAFFTKADAEAKLKELRGE